MCGMKEGWDKCTRVESDEFFCLCRFFIENKGITPSTDNETFTDE
jgi:hypothetical protein